MVSKRLLVEVITGLCMFRRISERMGYLGGDSIWSNKEVVSIQYLLCEDTTVISTKGHTIIFSRYQMFETFQKLELVSSGTKCITMSLRAFEYV